MATPANCHPANGKHRSRLSSKPSAAVCSANYFLATASMAPDREEARRRLALDGRVVLHMVSNSGGNDCGETDDLQMASELPRRVTFSAGGASEPQQTADGETQHSAQAPVAGSGRLWRGAAASICAGQRLQSLQRHVAEIKQRQEIHTELKAWVQQVLSAPETDSLLLSEQDDSDSPSADCSDPGILHQVHQHHQGQFTQQHENVQQLARVRNGDMQDLQQQQMFATTNSLRHDRLLSEDTAGLASVHLNSLPPMQHETTAAQPVAAGADHSYLATTVGMQGGCGVALPLGQQQDAASWQQSNLSEQRLIQQLKSDQEMLLEQLRQAYQQVADLTAAQQVNAAAASATAPAGVTLEPNSSHASCKQASGAQAGVCQHEPKLAYQSADNSFAQLCASNSTTCDVGCREDSRQLQKAQTLQLQSGFAARHQQKQQVPLQKIEEQPWQQRCQQQRSQPLRQQQQQQEQNQQCEVSPRRHEQEGRHSSSVTGDSPCHLNTLNPGSHRRNIPVSSTSTSPQRRGADALCHPQQPVSSSSQSTPRAGAGSKSRPTSSSMHAPQQAVNSSPQPTPRSRASTTNSSSRNHGLKQPVSRTPQPTPRSMASTTNTNPSSAKHATQQPVCSSPQPTPRSRASTTSAQHTVHQPVSSSPQPPPPALQPVSTGAEKPHDTQAMSHKAASHPETPSRSSLSRARHSVEPTSISRAGRVTALPARGLSVEQQQALVDRLHHAEQVMQLLQQDLHAALEAQQSLEQQLQEQQRCSSSAVVSQQQHDCVGECEVSSEPQQQQQAAVQQDQLGGQEVLRREAAVTQALAQHADATRDVVSCIQHASQQGPDLEEPQVQLHDHQQELQLEQQHAEHLQQQDGMQQELQQPADACVQQHQDVTLLQQQQQPVGVQQPQLLAEQALIQLAGDLLQKQAEASPSTTSACCQHESRCQQLQTMLQALVAQVQALAHSTHTQSPGSTTTPVCSPRKVVRSTWQHRPIALHTWLCPPPSSPRQYPQASLPAMLMTSMTPQKDLLLDMSPRLLPSWQSCQASTSQQPSSPATVPHEEVICSRPPRCFSYRPQPPLSARYPSMTATMIKHDGDAVPVECRLRPLTYRGPNTTQSSSVDITFGTKQVSVDAEHGLLASLRIAPLSARRQHHAAAQFPHCAERQPSGVPQSRSGRPVRRCPSAKYRAAARAHSAGPAVGGSNSSCIQRSQQQRAARIAGYENAGMRKSQGNVYLML